MATTTLGGKKKATADTKASDTKAAKPAVATDAGVEAPAAPEPFYAQGEMARIASTISFAPIDPSLDPEARKERVRQLLHQSVDAEGKLEILQGELLFEANNNGYWKTWFVPGTDKPYTDWDHFVKEELGISRRTSFTRIDLYKTFVLTLKVPEERLKNLEWSKASLVTKLLTEENWPDVLDKISTLPHSKVLDFVKEVKSAGDVAQAYATVTAPKAITTTDAGVATPTATGTPAGGTKDTDSFKTLKLSLSAAQYENITGAIGVCKEAVGSDSDAHALDIICSEYLSNNPGDKNKMATVAAIIQSLESNFGVVVEVKDAPQDLMKDSE